MRRGELTVVGSGIQPGLQTTVAALHAMQSAEKLLFLTADSLSTRWFLQQNRCAESLHSSYSTTRPREESYAEIVERVIRAVREEQIVCFATYGHPGVFADPTHAAIAVARSEGFRARMLPGISAEDCLFADLGVDPGARGCQSYEATSFLVYRRRIDTRSALILWQIGAVGDLYAHPTKKIWNLAGLEILIEVLTQLYGPEHGCIVYEASSLPACEPSIQHATIGRLAETEIRVFSTLFVPPVPERAPDAEMLRRLGLETIAGAALENEPRQVNA